MDSGSCADRHTPPAVNIDALTPRDFHSTSVDREARLDGEPRGWLSRGRETVRPAKGDLQTSDKLHSPTSPEEFSVLVTCGDAATLDAIVNMASRMSGVRVVVENYKGGA